MRTKTKVGVGLLIVGTVILFYGALFFCVSNTPEIDIARVDTHNIAAQSGSDIVKFTMNDNYRNYLLFDVNGTCTISNSSWVKIQNETGETVFNYPIDSFPNNATVPEKGRYVAVFQGVTLDPETFYMVYVNTYSYTQIFPASGLLPYSAGLGIIGLILFAVGMKLAVFSNTIKKVTQQIEKSTTSKSYARIDRAAIITYLLTLPIFVYVTLNNLNFPHFFELFPIMNETAFKITVSVTAFIIGAIYYWGAIRFLRRISIKMSFEHILLLQRLIKIASIIFILSFGFLVVTLFIQNGLFVALALYWVLTAFFIYFVFVPFNSMLSKTGVITLPLTKFIHDYKENPDKADFRFLSSAAREISQLIKELNIMIPYASLSLGMSYHLIESKSTDKLEAILKQFEQPTLEYKNILPSLEYFAGYGCYLESTGMKALPSPSDIYWKILPIGVAIVAAILPNLI